jgi:hypothetical protein
MQICVRDETISGQSLYELSLEFLSERVTVRELIRERVHHEVREFNRQQDRLIFHGLVQPEDTERTLNGSKLKAHRPLDWEAQFALAVEGFATNAYFVIIDDRQAETLDETFVVGPQTTVSFVKLTPLSREVRLGKFGRVHSSFPFSVDDPLAAEHALVSSLGARGRRQPSGRPLLRRCRVEGFTQWARLVGEHP